MPKTQRDLNEYELKSKQKIKDAIEIIMRELNGGNRNTIASFINEAIQRDHRTLQQNFWSAMFLAQKEYGETASSDLRNEASVALAKVVTKAAVDANLDYLPYI